MQVSIHKGSLSPVPGAGKGKIGQGDVLLFSSLRRCDAALSPRGGFWSQKAAQGAQEPGAAARLPWPLMLSRDAVL